MQQYCRLFYIASVGIPFLLPLQALSKLSWKVTGVGANVMRSTKKELDITFLFRARVLDEDLTILNGLYFGYRNLLYESVANQSAARSPKAGDRYTPTVWCMPAVVHCKLFCLRGF